MRIGNTDIRSYSAFTPSTLIRRWRRLDRRVDIAFGITLVALVASAIVWSASIRDCKREADKRRPTNWDEAQYVKSNPEVKKDIAIGIYSNPYQKYYCETASKP